ncbi:SDR family NAD(P)-dependent oxidoreductase [Mycolicibacterium sp.]|uniref:SDR family NAD(P)-dependent oxidoreductase n=1 Tax=Mycolicibacterium sp. TaxID=2320850 RepID=UPI0037CBE619
MSDPFRLDGRTVIVTGASRGIGAATARAIAARGGKVVLVARSEAPLRAIADELPTPSAVVAGDVADTQVIGDAITAGEELGGLWGLVNNAGINPHYQPVSATPLSAWDEVLQVNLLGAAAFARAMALYLSEAGEGGRIINISSIGGLTGLPNIGAYNASKAALDGLTRSLAVELGPEGILCNSIAPGTITTEMVDDLMAANPALKEKLVAKAPLGRLGSVDEAAGPIVFLLTDAAAFITGQTIVVDGGRLAAG